MRKLVIEKEEWGHLSDPASLARYWEPTQAPGDFHCTFALAFCQTAFHDCEDHNQKKEFIVSVAVVRKPSWYVGLPFSTAADEFWEDVKATPTLLLFLNIYFDQYKQHFTLMHDSGVPYNVGHPQKFVGALLQNAFQAGDTVSPIVKLPPAYLDHLTKFPIDSHAREYRDWTTGCRDQSSLDEHFIWLSNEFTPFQTDPGVPYVLDPAEYPRSAVQSHHESASLSSGDERRKRRKKKKHCRAKKPELKVTTLGQGDDAPIWSHTGSNLCSGSDSQTKADSGISSYQKPQNDARSTTRWEHTPWYSPNTIRILDEGDLEDAPLSDHGVWKSLRRSTTIDRTLLWGASAAICHWVWAVHLAMDCLEESIEEQSRLLQEAWKAGKEATKDILNLFPAEESPYLTMVVPREDILIPALTATRNHTEKATDTVNVQLSALVHRHFLPDQAGVFLASLLQMMCSYWQEMDGMATNQVILPGQIVLNLSGVSLHGLFKSICRSRANPEKVFHIR